MRRSPMHTMNVKIATAFEELTGRAITEQEIHDFVATIPSDLQADLMHGLSVDGGKGQLKHLLQEWDVVKGCKIYLGVVDGKLERNYVRSNEEVQKLISSVFEEISGREVTETECFTILASMPGDILTSIANKKDEDRVRDSLFNWMKKQDSILYTNGPRKPEVNDKKTYHTITNNTFGAHHIKHHGLNNTVLCGHQINDMKGVERAFMKLDDSRMCHKCRALMTSPESTPQEKAADMFYNNIMEIVNRSNMSQADSDDLMGELDNLVKVLKGDMFK